jgi:hypothetical protein
VNDGEADGDPYEVLGLRPGAKPEEVVSAYLRMSSRHSPTWRKRGGDAGRQAEVDAAFLALRQPSQPLPSARPSSSGELWLDGLKARIAGAPPASMEGVSRPPQPLARSPEDGGSGHFGVQTPSGGPWWRWPLVLPAAIGAWALTGVAVHFVLVMTFGAALQDAETLAMRVENALWMGIGSWAFVVYGSRTAPNHRYVVAQALGALVLMALAALLAAIFTFISADDGGRYEADEWTLLVATSVVVATLAGTVAGVVTVYRAEAVPSPRGLSAPAE